MKCPNCNSEHFVGVPDPDMSSKNTLYNCKECNEYWDFYGYTVNRAREQMPLPSEFPYPTIQIPFFDNRVNHLKPTSEALSSSTFSNVITFEKEFVGDIAIGWKLLTIERR